MDAVLAMSQFNEHLTESQKLELFEVLDKYPECFSETPGFTPDVVTHSIPLKDGFKPKRLLVYRIPCSAGVNIS